MHDVARLHVLPLRRDVVRLKERELVAEHAIVRVVGGATMGALGFVAFQPLPTSDR